MRMILIACLVLVCSVVQGRDTVRVRSKNVCVNGVCGVAKAPTLELKTRTRTSSRVR